MHLTAIIFSTTLLLLFQQIQTSAAIAELPSFSSTLPKVSSGPRSSMGIPVSGGLHANHRFEDAVTEVNENLPNRLSYIHGKFRETDGEEPPQYHSREAMKDKAALWTEKGASHTVPDRLFVQQPPNVDEAVEESKKVVKRAEILFGLLREGGLLAIFQYLTGADSQKQESSTGDKI